MQQAAAALNQSGDAVDLSSLNGFLKRERWQNSRQALCEHGLTRSGRPNHKDVVRSGCGHFQGALSHGLAAHVAKIRRGGRFGLMAILAGRRRRELAGPQQHRHHFSQIACPIHIDALHHGGFGRVFGGHNDVGDAHIARAYGHRKRAAHRPDSPVE